MNEDHNSNVEGAPDFPGFVVSLHMALGLVIPYHEYPLKMNFSTTQKISQGADIRSTRREKWLQQSLDAEWSPELVLSGVRNSLKIIVVTS